MAGSVKSIDDESANSAGRILFSNFNIFNSISLEKKTLKLKINISDKDIEVSRLPSLTHTGNITNEEVGLPLRVFGRGIHIYFLKIVITSFNFS